jgi:hypothetical protein
MKVWILTMEYNRYDHYGEYFIKAYKTKPTREQLLVADVSINEENVDWILAGGGRQYSEDWWFHLKEIEAE